MSISLEGNELRGDELFENFTSCNPVFAAVPKSTQQQECEITMVHLVSDCRQLPAGCRAALGEVLEAACCFSACRKEMRGNFPLQIGVLKVYLQIKKEKSDSICSKYCKPGLFLYSIVIGLLVCCKI